MNLVEEKSLSFFKRFFIYQSERFAFLPHFLMITAFTFSAASYSRISRGEDSFIPLLFFIVGVITSFGFFFLLRIFDEFKDFEKDSKYQPYRAVPRGLISLKELRILAIIIIFFQVAINAALMPEMLVAYFVVMAYMFIMTKEFFVKKWLIAHPLVYMASHMLIMPLIDFYTTGLDWFNFSVSPSKGLIFFLILTFCNGIVIEIGRKIRAEGSEEEGVETYSFLWGAKNATIVWLLVLLVTFSFAVCASLFAGFGFLGLSVLVVFLLCCSLPAFIFIKKKQQKYARFIELSSAIWTIGMYLTLGGVPMLIKFLL